MRNRRFARLGAATLGPLPEMVDVKMPSSGPQDIELYKVLHVIYGADELATAANVGAENTAPGMAELLIAVHGDEFKAVPLRKIESADPSVVTLCSLGWVELGDDKRFTVTDKGVYWINRFRAMNNLRERK